MTNGVCLCAFVQTHRSIGNERYRFMVLLLWLLLVVMAVSLCRRIQVNKDYKVSQRWSNFVSKCGDVESKYEVAGMCTWAGGIHCCCCDVA